MVSSRGLQKAFARRYPTTRVLTLLVLSMLVASAASTAVAQYATPQPQSASLDEARSSQTVPTEDVNVLTAQLATMQSFTDRLLATVYWSLGTVVVLVALLVGFSWFSSMRLHDREMTAIRGELVGMINSRIDALRSDLETLANDQVAEIRTNSADSAQTLLRPVQASERVLESSLAKLHLQQAYTSLQSEAWYWEAKGVKGNEFTQYLSILGLAAKQENATKVSSSLKKLHQLITAGTTLHDGDIRRLVAIMDDLSGEYAIQVEALRAALRDVKTY